LLPKRAKIDALKIKSPVTPGLPLIDQAVSAQSESHCTLRAPPGQSGGAFFVGWLSGRISQSPPAAAPQIERILDAA
jgi:hypothetical protein